MFIELSEAQEEYRNQAAEILFQASKSITVDSWPTIESAREEVAECCHREYIACGFVENDELAGWAGLRPMYKTITWELHPMMVKPAMQGKGIGSRLLKELERRAAERNVLNIILGTDDELDKTSLAKKDLYACDLFHEIENIKNCGNHPYEFYEKNGYKIVGVIPDANGFGKPDIIMGKRIGGRGFRRL
ncbi:MAG: GNAT family N-acetyltransferase [Spirochaetales bacterium]|nr:GNAT family N-acetyltransferase [Spirochaetales bacterium]